MHFLLYFFLLLSFFFFFGSQPTVAHVAAPLSLRLGREIIWGWQEVGGWGGGGLFERDEGLFFGVDCRAVVEEGTKKSGVQCAFKNVVPYIMVLFFRASFFFSVSFPSIYCDLMPFSFLYFFCLLFGCFCLAARMNGGLCFFLLESLFAVLVLRLHYVAFSPSYFFLLFLLVVVVLCARTRRTGHAGDWGMGLVLFYVCVVCR